MLKNLILFFTFVTANILFGEDRVAFITGGASGIGAATVREFVRQKIKVGFLDIDQETGRALASGCVEKF